MARLLNRDAQVDGNVVKLGGFYSHADALGALVDERIAAELADELADAVLALNPTAGELGEGMACNLQDLARRYQDAAQ